MFTREIQTQFGKVKIEEWGYYCSKCRKTIYPYRKELKIYNENYSPDLLHKIVYAGVNTNTSFKQAEKTLKELANIDISDSHIQRIVARIGKEFNKKDEK